MRVLVCGGRHFSDVPKLWRYLDDLLAREPERGIDEIIEGASDDVTGPYVGADYWAHQWAIARDVGTTRFHAFWKEQGPAAGPIRNQRMLDEGHHKIGLAFVGNRGTANMIEKAEAAGVRIERVR